MLCLIWVSMAMGFFLHGVVTDTGPHWGWYVAGLGLNMAILGCFVVVLKRTKRWGG